MSNFKHFGKKLFFSIQNDLTLRDAFKKKSENFGDSAQKEGGGQFQNPIIFSLKLGHFIEEGGVKAKIPKFFKQV